MTLPITGSSSSTLLLNSTVSFPVVGLTPKRRTIGFCVWSGRRKRCLVGVRATMRQHAQGWFMPVECPITRAIENKIKEQLEADNVVVRDTTGDARHISIDVISKMFEGQSATNRQRMVYIAILEEIQTIVHAVDEMNTRTPNEAAGEN